MGNSLEHIGTEDSFLNRIPTAKTLKETINKLDFIKLKSSTANDTVNSTKWWPAGWEKIFTNLESDGGLISKINKDLKTLDISLNMI